MHSLGRKLLCLFIQTTWKACQRCCRLKNKYRNVTSKLHSVTWCVNDWQIQRASLLLLYAVGVDRDSIAQPLKLRLLYMFACFRDWRWGRFDSGLTDSPLMKQTRPHRYDIIALQSRFCFLFWVHSLMRANVYENISNILIYCIISTIKPHPTLLLAECSVLTKAIKTFLFI